MSKETTTITAMISNRRRMKKQIRQKSFFSIVLFCFLLFPNVFAIAINLPTIESWYLLYLVFYKSLRLRKQ